MIPMIKLKGESLTLKHFLQFPEVKPALEFFGGRVVQKMSPNRPHSSIQVCLGSHLLQFTRLAQSGKIYSELRCTFGGESHVPDLCFIAKGRIPRDSKGELVSKIRIAPDLAIEIVSPGQTIGELTAKLRFAIKNGLRLGWLIDPRKKQVTILKPKLRAKVLRLGDVLSGEEVLPGYSLSLDELFSWQDED
jgi:Uma2 family endonuclease